MADDKHNDGKNEKKGNEIKVPPRTWLLWIGILALIPLLWKFNKNFETKYRVPSHAEFVNLVTNDLIIEGTINYNPQTEHGLNEITGRYWEVKGPGPNDRSEMPFKIKTRLLPDLEKMLWASGKFKGSEPNTLLLGGAPGTGKTLLAKAIAGEADAAFFSISGSDFVEMFVGVGASRVRDMFEQARRNTPCLIFIDEIDAVGRSRGHGLGGGNDEREQTLNALLVEMDGFDTQEGIIIIAATNRPDVLDPALLRPGRFDRQITVNLPDVRGREAILKVHAKNVKLAPGVDLSVIARGTPGYSGAELANLLNEAALLAARTNKKGVGMKELEEARDKVRWGRERRSMAMSDEEKRATAWHEAGHALVNVLLKHTHPLHKVTIIPRGRALGVTMSLPKDDVLNRKRKEMLDMIAVTMAGRIAEEIISDDISTGAAGDIQQATQMARAMVTQWGMSDKLGMVQYGDHNEYVFLGREMTRGKDYSERTAQDIDNEVKRIIDEAYKVARTIIDKYRDKLEIIANCLLEYETLEGFQVEEIVQTGKFTPPPPTPQVGPPTGAQAATPLPEVIKPAPPKIGPG